MWLLYAACAHPPAVNAGARATVGDGLALIDEGDLRDLVATPGRPTLLNVWATWCGPCRSELPMLAALATDHPDLRVLLLNVDLPADRRRAAAIVAKFPTDNLQLSATDLASSLQRTLPAWSGSIPLTLVLDADGKVARSYQGATTRTELESVIRTTLAGSPPQP